jgi:hypothetical protein
MLKSLEEISSHDDAPHCLKHEMLERVPTHQQVVPLMAIYARCFQIYKRLRAFGTEFHG